MGHQLVSHLHIETAHKSHHTDASHLVWSQSQSQSHKGFPSHQKKKEELNLYHGEEGGREKGESRVQTRSVCGGGGDDGYQREHPHIVPSVQTYISFFFLRDTKFAPKKSISTRRNRHTYGCSRYAAIQLCFCFLVPRSTQFPLYPVG